MDEATGQAFMGTKQWTEPGGEIVSESVRGVVTSDGRVRIVDEDGWIDGVVSGSQITGAYLELGADQAALAVDLTRQ